MFLAVWDRAKGVERNQKEKRLGAASKLEHRPWEAGAQAPGRHSWDQGPSPGPLRASLGKMWGQPYPAPQSLSFHEVREKMLQGVNAFGITGGFRQ